MALNIPSTVGISGDLLKAIRTFPSQRRVKHCGIEFVAPAFDFHAECPECSARIKLRSFSAVPEIEDIFDAVFEWMNHPEVQALSKRRMLGLSEDD